jgi:DNA-binding CsgD family transcriptional regulator/tetratricopeptide (TPR) repeat protein
MDDPLRCNHAAFDAARNALFGGHFEDVLLLCDALDATVRHDIDADLLRARAYIALGQGEHALALLRRAREPQLSFDQMLTVEMLEGAALTRLSRLDAALRVLSNAHEKATSAHPTVRAEISVHLGAALYRRGKYDHALRLLERVPAKADILRARATVLEAWVAFERSKPDVALERFRRALHEINQARHYDRFVEASAIYGVAFMCAELGRVDVWPELRARVQRFDWSAPGVAQPQFYLAFAASYVTEMAGESDEAERWASRAQATAPDAAREILALIRLAALTGRYGEIRAHAHFVRAALRRYDAVGPETLAREEFGLPLALAEEVAQGPNPADTAALLTFHREVVAPRLQRTKDYAQVAAAESFVRGLLEDAYGHTGRATAHYVDAFNRYREMGYRRRAAICAHRISSSAPDSAHRRFLTQFVEPLHEDYWLRQRVTSPGDLGVQLSERQTRILALVAAGKSNKEIAAERGGSWYTARNVVRELIALFGVRSRSDLVRIAVARGIVNPRESEIA